MKKVLDSGEMTVKVFDKGGYLQGCRLCEAVLSPAFTEIGCFECFWLLDLETLQQILIKLLNQSAYTQIDEGKSKYRLLQYCISWNELLK